MPTKKRPRHASPSSPLQPDQNLNGEQNDEYTSVKLSLISKEVQCPICLGILRKTRTVMECLHRFCKECIDKSMRLGNHECPLCRTHCSSRRSLRDDPNFDALIAAIYPDIDKYEKEELAFREEDGASKKQIRDSTVQTLRQQSEALGRKGSEKATASACAQNVPMARRNHPTSEHQGSDDEGGLESASRAEFYNNLSTDQIVIKLNSSLSDFIEAVAAMRLRVARFQTEQEEMKNSIRVLTEELKMSTDQVSRLNKKIAELETINQEQGVRLQELGQVQNENTQLTKKMKASGHKVSRLEQKIAELETINKEQASKLQELEQSQSENPQLVKECVRRLFRTKGFEDFVWKLLIPAYKYGAHHCAVSVMEHHSDIPLKVFEGKGYDPTIAEELDIVCANALMNDDLDFPLLHEVAHLAEPLTLSTLKRLVVDENTRLANPTSSPGSKTGV